MSARVEASVILAEPESFSVMAAAFMGTDYDYTTIVVVDGRPTPGWHLIDHVPYLNERYHFVLRHPLDEKAGIAEYMCVRASSDGREIEVVQSVLTQNDNDYKSKGFERFASFFLVLTR